MMRCGACGCQLQGNEKRCPECGKELVYASPVKTPLAEQPNLPSEQTAARTDVSVTYESKFTGGAFANFFIELLSALISVITLGLAYPAMQCWKLRWKASHTYINGCKLIFDGKGIQLFGKYILWLLLSIVTIGIYFIFAMPLNMKRWESKHTHFEGSEGESEFDGSIFGLFGVNLLTNFVTIITFSLGAYWAHCYRERWYRKHQVIDGCRLTFDGKGIQYFGKMIVWVLLTIVTLGIYSFWLTVNMEKWTISHVRAQNAATIPAGAQACRKAKIEEKKPINTAVLGFVFIMVGISLFHIVCVGVLERNFGGYFLYFSEITWWAWLLSLAVFMSQVIILGSLITGLILSICSLKKEKNFSIAGIILSIFYIVAMIRFYGVIFIH